MVKVLCFGNPNFEEDALALKVGRKLRGKIRGIEFVECGMDDKLLGEEAGEFLVLDVVKGISGVRFVEPEELKPARTITAHDIDVSFYIRLLAKDGKMIRIIGIPEGMETRKAAEDVRKLISSFGKDR